MKTEFYCAPNETLKVNDFSTLASSSIEKVFSFARKHVTNLVSYTIYLVFTDVDATGDTYFIYKKLFEIHENFVLPIITDHDLYRVPSKS